MDSGKVKIGEKEIDFGYALKRYITSSGVQDGEKIIYDSKDGQEENPDEVGQLKKQMEQAAQIIQQLAQKVQEIQQKSQQKPTKSPIESMSYKDVPEDVKRQIEAQAGLKPSEMGANPILNQIHKMTPQAPPQQAPPMPAQGPQPTPPMQPNQKLINNQPQQ